jgi:hypothetical protein
MAHQSRIDRKRISVSVILPMLLRQRKICFECDFAPSAPCAQWFTVATRIGVERRRRLNSYDGRSARYGFGLRHDSL